MNIEYSIKQIQFILILIQQENKNLVSGQKELKKVDKFENQRWHLGAKPNNFCLKSKYQSWMLRFKEALFDTHLQLSKKFLPKYIAFFGKWCTLIKAATIQHFESNIYEDDHELLFRLILYKIINIEQLTFDYLCLSNCHLQVKEMWEEEISIILLNENNKWDAKHNK